MSPLGGAGPGRQHRWGASASPDGRSLGSAVSAYTHPNPHGLCREGGAGSARTANRKYYAEPNRKCPAEQNRIGLRRGYGCEQSVSSSVEEGVLRPGSCCESRGGASLKTRGDRTPSLQMPEERAQGAAQPHALPMPVRRQSYTLGESHAASSCLRVGKSTWKKGFLRRQ